MILVSACLLGMNCRFDGGNNTHPQIREMVKSENILPVCPEQLGGLPTPRAPAEIQKNKTVFTSRGDNVTPSFIKGGEETLNLARLFGIKKAILKDGSPSCGSTYIYDGTFTGKKIPGMGITTSLLRQNGFDVFSEKDLTKR